MSSQERKHSLQIEALKSAGTHDKVILLDIDGVVCEPQTPISDKMHTSLHALCRQYQVFFVTGNSYTKAVDLINSHQAHFSGIFCNAADELRTMRGKLVWKDAETQPLPVSIERTLQCFLSLCLIDEHHGNRIEWRSPRMINFSHIGRYAPKESRDAHDSSWRDDHIRAIKALYPDVVVEKGGQISLDIHSAGADKSRAAKYINETLRKDFVFLGDRTEEGGNDYPVKKYCDECPKNVCLQVNSIEDTFAIIDALLMKGVSI